MSTGTEERSELQVLEAEVLEGLDAEHGHLEADLEAAADEAEQEQEEAEDVERSPVRLAIATALPTIAAAVMVGGVFLGIDARFYAGIAGLLGIGLALGVRQVRNPVASNLLIIGGLFAIGLLMVVPTGAGDVARIGTLASEAAASGDVLRPPVPFTPGWQAVVGWLLGIVGFASAWLAVVVRRPSLALLVPLPVAAIAGISVPDSQQVASGLTVLVLFAVGLGVLSSAQTVGDGDEKPPLGYELRRAARALPLIAVITVAMYFLSQTNFLFPEPRIDPTQEPQKPKTVPISEVEDRVLFEVESSISGPWRMGSLDVYDGEDWRLPPFAENKLEDVPESGIVDDELAQGVSATFFVAGLEGAVLPGLPNTVGIAAEGPKLAYDARSGNIRVSQGQIQSGLEYAVTAAALPTADDLRNVSPDVPTEAKPFVEIPQPPPPEVQGLIDQAPDDSKWDQFDFLRTWILDNVTATGAGTPVGVTPDRVADMIGGSKEATPYEIVAAQAMLARWVGVPSRIGYGFDGGELIEDRLQVRPKNGATFVEVFFTGYKWLPVIGTPKKAKPTVGGEASEQQFDPTVLPSDEATVQLFLPVFVDPDSVLAETIRNIVLLALPIALALALLYILFPALRKAIVRSRRRAAAEEAGPRARLALAYAEWRDYAADYGFAYPTDTPLMFLDRFTDDAEHAELAWLVTRGLWGDLQHDLTDAHATAAEELSRALRGRLAQAQPATVRAVAVVSRLSLRHPYAPETDLTHRKQKKQKEATRAVPAPA